ncbi:MAG: hypothetical protein Q8O86_02580, partial [Dehalococcoidia bacterium]|nr:hypothetical protein [Dehalococcoidia bacterium]
SIISGTVKGPTGSPLDGAWVWADLPRTSNSPARFVKGQVSKDGGKYSLWLPSSSTYNIRAAVAEERGYISPEMVAVTITVPATITQDLQFRQSDARIQGVVTLGGSAHASFVRAWGEKGGQATATAGDDGSYTLSVTKNDRWRLVAVSEVGGKLYRSDPAIISVGETTPIIFNLTLKEVGTVPTSVSITFDASQMQVISLSDGTQVTIPGGALAVSGTVSVLAVPKSSVPAQKGAEPLSLGYDLAATYADGNAITSFLRNVTVVINYTEAQLAALGITEDQVVAKYWDTTTSTWKTPDNVIQDRENNTLTISTNHFTIFAGVLGSGDITAGALTKIYVPFAAKNSSGGW